MAKDTEQLDYACRLMYGHTDWEFVDSKLLKRFDDGNYTVVLFHHIDRERKEKYG